MPNHSASEELIPPIKWVQDHTEPPPFTEIGALLAERELRYGKFSEHAALSQGLLEVMATGRWDDLSLAQKEALEMVAHKIARILNGDPNYIDNWVDICGYSQLVVDILRAGVEET